MKFFNNKHLLPAACIALLLLISCKKDKTSAGLNSGGGNSDNSSGLVTAVGTPVGNAESKIIGAAGGSFTTSDGRLTIEFPAGALNNDNTITAEPITNNTTGGSGNAYRISPHNIIFNLPVKISFNYGDSDLVNSIPAAMAIAYQDQQHIWQAVGGGVNDTVNRRVSVFTNHFSDWSLFKKLIIVPGLSFVEPGGGVSLHVLRTVDLTDDLDIPLPGVVVKDSLAASIKEWKLAGAGSLAPNGSEANYTAPAQIPERNPVAVSATLNTNGVAEFILVANIYIGGEGITFRIDNGAWLHASCPLGAVTTAGVTLISGSPVVNNNPAGSVSLKWKGHTLLENINWDLDFPEFNYAPGGTVNYWHFYIQGGNAIASPGGINFYRYRSVGDYVSGIFLLDKSGKSFTANNTTVWEIHKVEGFFNVKISN